MFGGHAALLPGDGARVLRHPAWRERTVASSFPPEAVDSPVEAPCVYAPSRTANGPAAAAAALLVGGLLAALAYMNIDAPALRKPHHLLVVALPLTPPPPPAQPRLRHVMPTPSHPEIVAPPPIVAVPAQPTALAVAPEPPPPVVVPAPAAPAALPSVPAAPPAIADGGDLSSRMIVAKPPSYPLESRRRHEQGTVVLSVLVSLEGAVAEIAIAQTSGSPALDRAALGAVRKWRWAPLVRGGHPVMVQGQVSIPFVLKS